MPSGAKKRRKAEKKKMEKIAHIIENQQGNGDSSRSHDEKDSDSSSVSSPRNPLMKNEQSDDDKSDDGRDRERDVSTAGSASDEPRDKEKKSQFEEVEVTKEVDFESKIVNIDDVKESSGEDLKEGSSNSNGEIEKKLEVVIVPKQIEDLNESKEVEVEVEKAESPVLSVIEPPTKEVVEVVSQPEVVTEAVEKIGNSGVIDAQSDDRELPQSNGTSVETVNGSGDTVESRLSTNSDNEKKNIFPVPPTVQRTSWKSCCGLFEVFGGSNR